MVGRFWPFPEETVDPSMLPIAVGFVRIALACLGLVATTSPIGCRIVLNNDYTNRLPTNDRPGPPPRRQAKHSSALAIKEDRLMALYPEPSGMF